MSSRPSSEPTFHADDAPAPGPVAPVPPERFVLGREIGRGAMGRVVEAVDRQFDRTVAVKLLLGTSAAARARFETEAVVTGQLEHPGIPSVYARGVLPDGTPFYAMRLAPGLPLHAALAESATMEERLRFLPALVQVAQAVGYAHERGVVHRDLKPENVLVGPFGQAFLLDWGIAKVRGRTADGGSAVALATAGTPTLDGSVLGTPAYMAPEQARGDLSAIDARTDVFALGAILYHLLSGRSPYRGPTAGDTLQAALQGQVEPLGVVARTAPPGLVAICERAMAPAPADRYADAGALARVLDGFVSSAVLARTTDRVDRFAQLASVGGLLLVLGTALLAWAAVPTLYEQGPASLLSLALAALGLSLSGLEWRTAGRYRLDGLSLVFAVCTSLVGLTGATLGIGNVLQFVLAAPRDDAAAVLVRGAWEAGGNLPGSAALTALQLVVWALVRRSHAAPGPRPGA
jgi:hypothetical protein